MKRLPRTLLASLLLLSLSQAEAGHRILLGSYGANDLMILNAEDQVEWRMPGLKKVTDVQTLPDGRILVAHTSGISEITPDYKSGSGGNKKLIWKVPGQSDFTGNMTIPEPQQKGETHSCQILPDGKILTGLSYDNNSYILEIDRAGTIHKRIHLPDYGKRHGSFRNIRKTPQGTYLLSRNGKPCTGLELDADGTVLRKFKEARYVLVRLPDGHTLVASTDTHRLYEVNPAGEEVWSLEENELQNISLAAVCGVQRLENGNTLVALWGGHGNLPGPAVIEVTRDKKMVWKTPDFVKNRVISLQVIGGGSLR